MSIQNNINFESYLPVGKYRNLNSTDTTRINKYIQKSIYQVKQKNNVFHSFSKDFKLNFNLKDLSKYKKFKRVIFIGMGGSILGAQSVENFLKKDLKKEIFFLNNLELYKIKALNNLKDLKNSLFVIISKSGSTIEVLSIINSLKNKAKFNQKNTLVITDNRKSHLSIFAKKNKIRIVFHRQHIGGRYSIFSETALVPCYLLGINIFKLRKNILNFLFKKRSVLIKNTINLLKIYKSKKINSLVLLNYCEGLEHFLLWCQQLIAESLGKDGKGILPLISIGPRDHHSLLQLFLNGPKDKFFYVFSFKGKKNTKKAKRYFPDALNNSSMNEVLESQKSAMISLLKSKKIPFLSIEIKKRDEKTLGELFSYFILETIFIGEEIKINPFNQPAVEQLKKLIKQNLFKKSRK